MDFQKFDHNHYSLVAKTRRELMLPHVKHQRVSSDFSLYNRKIRNKFTGKIYTIDNVTENWYLGWYRIVTARDENNSHIVRCVKNISSSFDHFTEEAIEFQHDFEVLDPYADV